MIIESAYFNTFFSLINQNGMPNEERIRGLFLQCIYDQFRIMHWDKTGIYSQCSYELDKKKLADLKVEYCLYLNNRINWDKYNIKENSWIEVKYLRNKSQEKEIKKDLLRLCLYVKELQGDIRCNSRYLLIFAEKNIDNKFIKDIFNDQNNLSFNYEGFETKAIITKWKILPNSSNDLRSILLRIDEFIVKISDMKIEYPKKFTCIDCNILMKMAKKFSSGKISESTIE